MDTAIPLRIRGCCVPVAPPLEADRADQLAAVFRAEYGRAVAGIGKAVIEPADLAARPQRQEACKQSALTAARTAAAEASVNRP